MYAHGRPTLEKELKGKKVLIHTIKVMVIHKKMSLIKVKSPLT